jgi:hypothetical protein
MSSRTIESASRSQHRERAPRQHIRRASSISEDDDRGCALEAMAVEGKHGELLVIHAMELRERCRKRYEGER